MTFYTLLSITFLALLFIARKPRTAENRQGKQFNADIRTDRIRNGQSTALTVASYNVQTGKSLAGKRDISRAANVLQNVDLAGIQEVYAPGWLNQLGLGLGQTESLAEPGQFSWLFCPTRYRWCKENRGNAILSKLPIQAWRTRMLPDQSGISFRNMTVVDFEWQGQNCHFINTHLHTSSGKKEQLTAVLNEFNQYSRVILVGDFNCKPDTDLLIELVNSSNVTDAISHSNIDDQNNDRIDWILTKGWKINKGRKINKGVSDHPYYEVTLELA